MNQPAKDNFHNWAFFLLGCLLFAQGFRGFYTFLTTGYVAFHHQRLFPFDLEGLDAATMYAVILLAGLMFLAAGANGLLRK